MRVARFSPGLGPDRVKSVEIYGSCIGAAQPRNESDRQNVGGRAPDPGPNRVPCVSPARDSGDAEAARTKTGSRDAVNAAHQLERGRELYARRAWLEIAEGGLTLDMSRVRDVTVDARTKLAG